MAPVALWRSPFRCFPSLSCSIAAVSPPALPNSSAANKAWLFSFSHVIPKNKSFASSLGFNIVVPTFNYYFSLNSIFLKRGFPFDTVFIYKPVILCEKCNLLYDELPIFFYSIDFFIFQDTLLLNLAASNCRSVYL